MINRVGTFLSAYALAELIDNAISATRDNKSGERIIQIHLVRFIYDLHTLICCLTWPVQKNFDTY